MAGKRNYGDGCAAAHALDLIGERWALLVVRELVLGPKRFTDLRRGLPNAGPNVVSQRLRELEETGVLLRRELPPPEAAHVYELTEWGRELEPVIQALGRWGARSTAKPDACLGTDSTILSLRTMFDGRAAGDLDFEAHLHLGEDSFAIRVTDGRLRIDREVSEGAATTVETEAGTLLELVYGDASVEDRVRAGTLRIDGDVEGFERLTRCFPLPASAPTPATAGV